jgi:hypothetical protein
LEQSHLCASSVHAVRQDTAEAILRERGWVVYRANFPRHDGSVAVFCRAQRNFQTRILTVKAAEIDRRLATRL